MCISSVIQNMKVSARTPFLMFGVMLWDHNICDSVCVLDNNVGMIDVPMIHMYSKTLFQQKFI